MDAPAFIILYSTYDRRVGPFSAIFLSLFAALSVSFAVIFTGIHEVYGGFSGLSCAAATAILMTMILENPRQAFPYFLCFIYCSYLLFMGGFASGVRVANEAHIAGAVSGLVFTLIRDRMLKLTSYCQPLRNTRHKVSRELNP
jgi:membrane associated rhomboid family serine protease